ncbi:acyl carrier protein [Bordetella petrii]|uniref:acyl carrier protein n=1 Tax=Bordetella petrii TaxID=94624 RepID=UPI0038B40511
MSSISTKLPPLPPISLPESGLLREKLAAIIAATCRCEPAPLLEDQEFGAVVAQFDSMAVLEILLEIETEFGLTTDEMLPTDHNLGAQEITSVFPKNLSGLMAYMQEVAARRATLQADATDPRAAWAARRASTDEQPSGCTEPDK